jgi:hypothetical protein
VKVNLQGRNRFVLLAFGYAVKVPSLRSWRDFLFGLLNNMNEAVHRGNPGVVPILFSCPGGWFNICLEVRIMTHEEFMGWDAVNHCLRHGVRAEYKADSYGWYRGSPVVVDYGW